MHRLFTSSYEAMFAIISLELYPRITDTFGVDLCALIFLQSFSFVIRNTSPIGWLPILLAKAYEHGFRAVMTNYIIGFVFITLPIVGFSVWLDSSFYGELTIVPWNFIKVNVFEGLSQTFGADPVHKYVSTEIPIRFNGFFPCLLYGLWHHWRTARNKNKSAYLLWFSVTVVGFLSLISHKEPKFLLPVFPVFFLFIGQYLQDQAYKQRPGFVKAYVILGVVVETCINMYFVHLHELAAYGPMRYIQANYPDYESVITSNKFEGNYLSLNHRRGGPQP